MPLSHGIALPLTLIETCKLNGVNPEVSAGLTVLAGEDDLFMGLDRAALAVRRDAS
jgi:hypothetical protein